MPCGCGPQQCANFDDDREGVSDADISRFGEDGITCPNCGSDVYHDAALCHACGYAITDESLRKPTPGWIPLAASLALAGLVLAAVGAWFVIW